MPEAASIEGLAEEVLIQIFRAHPALHGKKIVHENEAQKADVDCIVVTANQAERDLSGPIGYRINITAEYRSMNAAVAQNDAVANAMRQAIERSATAHLDCLSQIQDLYFINEEIQGDRGNTKNLRLRSLTVPIILLPK